MNRRTFMKKLMFYLKNISEKERNQIEDFYNEIFDDSGIKLDDEVPESFGNPRKIAMEILADDIELNENKEKKGRKKKGAFWKFSNFFKKFSYVCLGILGYPIAIISIPIIAILGIFLPIALVFGVIFLVSSVRICTSDSPHSDTREKMSSWRSMLPKHIKG